MASTLSKITNETKICFFTGWTILRKRSEIARQCSRNLNVCKGVRGRHLKSSNSIVRWCGVAGNGRDIVNLTKDSERKSTSGVSKPKNLFVLINPVGKCCYHRHLSNSNQISSSKKIPPLCAARDILVLRCLLCEWRKKCPSSPLSCALSRKELPLSSRTTITL